jgi:c-di-GMP-related signal transduction protein
MQSYKERVKKLRQAEDPEEHVIKLAMTIFPNKDKYHKVMDDYKSWYGQDPKILSAIMDLYKLYYELAKDSFITEKQVDEEAEDFLSSL